MLLFDDWVYDIVFLCFVMFSVEMYVYWDG